MVRLTGEVHPDPAAPPLDRARVRVLVEDTTAADAAATVVARVDLADVSWRRTDPPVPFALDVPEPARGRRYTVRVHALAAPDRGVDPDRVRVGDQVSVDSVPVTGPAPLTVRLRAVG